MTTATRYDFSLEVIAPLIFGLFMCQFGALRYMIYSGALPYAPDSMYGLLLVLVAIQTVAMGKTPFGDFRRSWALVGIGIGASVVGMVACFIPGLLTETVRALVGLLLTGGGATLLFQLAVRGDRARAWIEGPRPLGHLASAAGLVYSLSLVAGILTLLPGVASGAQTATLFFVYGTGFIYLAWALLETRKRFGPPPPDHARPPGKDAARRNQRALGAPEIQLPLNVAILLLQAILLVILGVLLFPVSIGVLPFSPDGQRGLLLVIMSIQILTLGATPVGDYPRSGPLMLLGFLFAAAGILSCIVPGLITEASGISLGLLNLIGGVLNLTRGLLSVISPGVKSSGPADQTPPILRAFALTVTVLNVAQIAFGLSMLLPTLMPPLVGAGLVVANGLLLLALTRILLKLDRLGPIAASASVAAQSRTEGGR